MHATEAPMPFCRWQVGPESAHQRTDNGLQADQWSYNIPVPGGAIYAAQVSLLQGKITAPYSGILSLLLVTGGNVTLPVQGVYQGTTYAPAVSQRALSSPVPVSASCCRPSRLSLRSLAGILDCSDSASISHANSLG